MTKDNVKNNVIEAFLKEQDHPITRMDKSERDAYIEKRTRKELSQFVVQLSSDRIKVTRLGKERYGPQFRQGGVDIESINTMDEFHAAYRDTREFVFSGLYETAEQYRSRATTQKAKDEVDILMDILQGDMESADQKIANQKRSELKAQLRVV